MRCFDTVLEVSPERLPQTRVSKHCKVIGSSLRCGLKPGLVGTPIPPQVPAGLGMGWGSREGSGGGQHQHVRMRVHVLMFSMCNMVSGHVMRVHVLMFSMCNMFSGHIMRVHVLIFSICNMFSMTMSACAHDHVQHMQHVPHDHECMCS